MAMNRIQFQHGMSLPEFLGNFGTEAACVRAVVAARWPAGFECPRCSAKAYCLASVNRRTLFQCNACRRQTSVTAGTLFEGTKLSLKTWFLAIYLLSQAKTSLSALALKRQLGVSYPTAWLLHHKIMCAMGEGDSGYRLTNVVQLDDAYLGGELYGGKTGRGSENKVPFVAAVSLNESGHPSYLKLSAVASFTREAIGQWARQNLVPGTLVACDGLICFWGVTDAGCIRVPTILSGRKPRDLPEFKWVNTVLGNLKTSLAGAHHAFKYRKYAAQYLAAFAYRFNRRFDLKALVRDLISTVVRCKPRSENVIRSAETRC
jgi:transposase-like protein